MSKYINGIDHIDLNVNDLENMVEYLKRAGFTEVRGIEETGGSVELRFPGVADGPILELRSSSDKPKGLQHLALRATDIDKAFVDFQKSGFDFQLPLKDQPTSSGRRVFNVTDPDGNILQVSTKS